ncbi:MAG: penicillin-binding protein 2 [Candidatus Saccharimonadales bacterium]
MPQRIIKPTGSTAALRRLRGWYVVMLLVATVFILRAFYLQVIRYDYYKNAALTSQLKQYQIPATRGLIEAHDGDNVVPLVLNQTLYTLFADPKYIKNAPQVAQKVANIIGGNANDYAKLMTAKSRYVILANKLSQSQKDKIDGLGYKGLGSRAADYRIYPEGSLAAQLLGFVDDSGQGQYGLEQALNSQLAGKPGMLKAITDAQGVPLVANKNNVNIQPVPGKTIVTSIDVSMQQQLEGILKAGLDKAHSKTGDALIIDPNSGAIIAMANYPSYDPATYYNVTNPSLFQNAAISSPLEVGSSMKPLTMAAALNVGAITKNETYYDPSHFLVDGFNITNIEEDGGPGVRSLADILQLSLNTGATWMLMQMGGGQINQKARDTWHDYMVNHFMFGKPTGIEQGYEEGGSIPDPDHGYGLDLQYANTAFGQGMTATPLQMGAALSAVVNGGTYYKPTLLSAIGNGSQMTAQKPTVVRRGVVEPTVSQTIQQFMEYTFTKNHVLYGMPESLDAYNIGGKTGTAQIANPAGGYYDDKFNGTFIGFVGGDQPQYVIVTRVDQPNIGGYAGSMAAAPIFSAAARMLINNFNVVPKSQ